VSLSIRPARTDEAGLVLSFVRELADYEQLSHEVVATPAMIGDALFGPAPSVFCDIAEWASEPVGFALWFASFSSFRGRKGIWLEDLYVRPTHRGRGVGRAFLQRLARRCVDENWGAFEWSVLDWNEPSIAFYRAQGAVLMDGWTTCRVAGDSLARLAAAER
jgi:diamine N-acetyltransferase